MTTQHRDSNEYEVAFTTEPDVEPVGAPADDRDEIDPEFEVEDELAYNLDIADSPY